MAEQGVLGRSTRRIAVSIVKGNAVTSLVLPDALVALALGAEVDEVADALVAGADTDPAFSRNGGAIVQSIAAKTPVGDLPAREGASTSYPERLQALAKALMLGTAIAGHPIEIAPTAATGALLDGVIENQSALLKLLQAIRDSERQLQSDAVRVELSSATGKFTHELPMSIDETLSSSEVGEILSPTGKGLRTISKRRRDANELLGVRIGNRYRYPKFQFDTRRHEVIPVVAYANRTWESQADPWGVLEWWYSPESAFEHRRPVDLVAEGELTTEMVDEAATYAGLGMD